MYRNERSLTLFFHEPLKEAELNALLLVVENPIQFCTAHELVNRNSITNNPKKIWKESRQARLKIFRFLINKN
jgi:hypothetical protein